MKCNKLYIILITLSALSVPLCAQSNLDINYIKAKALVNGSAFDSALIYLDKAYSINSKNNDILLEKGKVYYFKAQYEIAIQEFMKLELIEKGKASIWLARSYACLNDIDNCLRFLESNLSGKYKLPESEIMLDHDFQRFERDPRWLKFWREGNWYTAFDKSMAEADFLIKTKKYPDAINLLSESLSKGFRKSPIYERRAMIYIELKNYNLALSDLNNAILAGNTNSYLFHQRARINYLSGNFRQSLDDYNNALKLSPNELSLYQERALVYSKNGMYNPALQDMNLYLTYYPKNDSAWYNFGLIHTDHENYIEALSCFNKSLSLNTSDPRYFAARGMAFLKSRTYMYAWRDFAMSLDLDPRNPEVYLNKGVASINLGDTEDACFCFQTAKRLGNNKAIGFIEKYCK